MMRIFAGYPQVSQKMCNFMKLLAVFLQLKRSPRARRRQGGK